LHAGHSNRVAAGSTDNFTITGSCAGTAQIVNSPATGATFEGVAGFMSVQSATVTFTNCAPTTSTATGSNFFDADYTPVGVTVTGAEYARFVAAPAALPASVKVGDGADIVTFTTYVDSNKLVATGKRVYSYAIEADSATTVIANFIVKTYDTTDRLLLTQQTRYRMAEDGTLTLLTIDVQYSASSTVHLLYTKV
jgi:hypothetical protein